MTHDEITRWYRSALARHYSAMQNFLLPRSDRKMLLTVKIGRVQEFANRVKTDLYLTEVFRMYVDGLLNGHSVEGILKKIEKRRVELYQQQKLGEDYNQPYIPVDEECIKEDRPNKILKFIANCYFSDHCAQVYANLYLAMKENAGEKKLQAILVNARNFEKSAAAEKKKEKVIGFDWHYPEKSVAQIGILLRELADQKFIEPETTIQEFFAAFTGKEILQKIRWTESTPHLLYLIQKLAVKFLKTPPSIDKFIESPKMKQGEKVLFSKWLYEKISAAFTDRSGKDFNSAKLKNAADQLQKKGSPPRASDIDAIILKMD